MNYRHAFHAGSFADVVKHAVLTRILVHLCTKPAAFRVIDTHAGAGLYDLAGEEASRSTEWRSGILRVLTTPIAEPARTLLAPYLDVVRGHNSAGAPEHDPEKWEPVFRKDHAQALKEEHDPEKWEPVFRKDHAQALKEEHDPEKWEPVFRKDHAQALKEEHDPEKWEPVFRKDHAQALKEEHDPEKWEPVFRKDHAQALKEEHDPEKWEPVFRKDHAQALKEEHDPEKWEPVFRKDHAQAPEELMVRDSIDTNLTLSTYPGSPALARAFLRPQDRLVACELEPNAAAALTRNFARDRRVKTVAIDGWIALNAYVPPVERRGVVVVDPPFEKADDFTRLERGLEAAHRKWAGGIYLLWYPIKSRDGPDAFARALKRSGIGKLLRAELSVTATPGRLGGCGLIVVNPPWTLESELAVILPALSAILCDGGGGHRLDWIAREN